MNSDNPLIPQGSLMEQKAKSRNRFKVAVFLVLAAHGIGLMALLMQGCRREEAPPVVDQQPMEADTNLYTLPPFEDPGTNYMDPGPSMVATSTPPPVMDPMIQTNYQAAPMVPDTVPASTEYVVAKGDSFTTIAKKFGVSVKAIADANPTVQPTRLQIGQKLQIPSGAQVTPPSAVAPQTGGGEQVYVVKSGDTLTKVARQHNTTVRAIRSANNLKTDAIRVGQKLKIPAAASPAPAQ